MEDSFVCAHCGNWYVKGRTDEEAVAEKEQLWPDVPVKDCAMICDDCFNKMVEAGYVPAQ